MSAKAEVVRVGAGYVRAEHKECGWFGISHSTRTVEGARMADRDASDHEAAHAGGGGWFHFLRGWVAA